LIATLAHSGFSGTRRNLKVASAAVMMHFTGVFMTPSEYVEHVHARAGREVKHDNPSEPLLH
jgi:hypothetical protein